MMERQKRRRTTVATVPNSNQEKGNCCKRISEVTDNRPNKYQRQEHDSTAVPNHCTSVNVNLVFEGLRAIATAPKEVISILENLGKANYNSNNYEKPSPLLAQENPSLSQFLPSVNAIPPSPPSVEEEEEGEFFDCHSSDDESSSDFEPNPPQKCDAKEEGAAELYKYKLEYVKLAKSFGFPGHQEIKKGTNGTFTVHLTQTTEKVTMQDCLVDNCLLKLPPFILARPKRTPRTNPHYFIGLDDAFMLLEFVSKQLALDKSSICFNKKYFDKLRKEIAKKMLNQSAYAPVLKNIDNILNGIQSTISGNK